MNDDAKTISLKHWLEYIENQHDKTVDFDLSRAKKVADDYGLGQFECPVVVIGGTNGKGSTTALLSKMLQHAGLKVGTYLSPHLVYFNERIVLDGRPCPEYLLCQAFAKIEDMRQKVPLTYFEFVTLAALWVFKQFNLDCIVLEVGCGGEKDAVNVVDSDLSLLTSISYDHMAWLGDTLEEIALTKSGIFRQNKSVILGVQAQLPCVIEKAKCLETHLYLEGDDFGWYDLNELYWQYQNDFIKVPEHHLPDSSVSLALAAYRVLKNEYSALTDFSYDALSKILRTAQLPGRFQRIYHGAFEVIFDVGHNPAGAKWLAQRLEMVKQRRKVVALWASLMDKDLAGITEPLIESVNYWIIAPLMIPRCATKEALESALKHHRVEADHYEIAEDIQQGYRQALKILGPDDILLVFGSFFTVKEILKQVDYLPLGNHFYEKNQPSLTAYT